ncbi:MAG TPA: NAD-dependent epimerase/dehydratase family protein [Miltoncostaeaceae bacterium]|nr:NAD-dependent epimerase/dehydratase family protein [Miltoncostaeaceae bacterium]
MTAMPNPVPVEAARVFLAGATGVIGRRVIPPLVAAGHPVTAMTRRAGRVDALRALGAEPVVADALDREGLRAAVAAARPDVVVHQLTDLAAYDVDANARVRGEGTRNLVDAARAAGARRMVAQSIAWCYAPGDGPADEGTPLDLAAGEPRRRTVQGVAALEGAVGEMPEWVVLRYGMLIGPGTWFAPDGARADDARAGLLEATGDVTSFVHADDAAAAAVQAIRWPSGAVNVCDDEPAAGHAWVPVFCAAVGAPPAPVRDGRAPWARGAANARARGLGWAPRHPWRDAFGA